MRGGIIDNFYFLLCSLLLSVLFTISLHFSNKLQVYKVKPLSLRVFFKVEELGKITQLSRLGR